MAMKKILILLFILVLGITGCEKKDYEPVETLVDTTWRNTYKGGDFKIVKEFSFAAEIVRYTSTATDEVSVITEGTYIWTPPIVQVSFTQGIYDGMTLIGVLDGRTLVFDSIPMSDDIFWMDVKFKKQ